MKRFKAGDFVQLKVGGRSMIVVKYSIDKEDRKLKVYVSWTIENIHKAATFFEDQLQKSIEAN